MQHFNNKTEVCPICDKAFDIQFFEQHIDYCVGLPQAKSPKKININTNIKKNAFNLPEENNATVNTQTLSNNNMYNQNNENIENLKEWMEYFNQRISKKGINNNLLNDDEYNKIQKDLNEFSNNFERYRQKTKKPAKSSLESGMISRNYNNCNNLGLSTEPCIKCKKLFSYESLLESQSCQHPICLQCLYQFLLEGIKNKKYSSEAVLCPIQNCKKNLPDWIINRVLHNKEVKENLSNQRIQYLIKTDKSIVKCPSCSFTFYKEPGDVNINNQISKEAADDKAKNRFRCTECRTEFCASCFSIPYHAGFTCKSHAEYKVAKKCRFCDKKLKKNKINKDDTLLVCSDDECIEKDNNSCLNKKSCGHLCFGIKYEKKCLPCLEKNCPNNKKNFDGNDFCNICWVEALNKAPCIKLACDHIFHYKCILIKINKKWPGARITFGYLLCPLCKTNISHQALHSLLKKHNKIYKDVKMKALKRLKIEGFENDKRIKDPSGKYFNDPQSFSMDRFAFYICHKCKEPYFGGIRQCEEVLHQSDEEFDPTHLICGSCSSGNDKNTCKLHGKDFITYKCKFCCNFANWFCWGKTHFCDSCHKKQIRGNYQTRKKRDQLKKCPGIEKCPLKIKHPENGVEYSIGCVICLRK